MTSRPYISCRELISDFLVEYFQGALTEIQTEDFQRHLSVCPSCRAYLATYEETIRAGKQVMSYSDAANEDAPEELVRAILEIRGR